MRWLACAVLILTLSIQVEATPVLVVQITSDSLLVEHQKSRAEFKGHVWLKRGDFELRSDRLVVYYRQEMGGEVEQAEAYGHVTMKQGDKSGSSNEALFQQSKNLLTLIGSGRVEGPEGVVEGEKILHNINTKKSTVLQGEGSRAHFVIEEDDLNKKEKDAKPSTEKSAP